MKIGIISGHILDDIVSNPEEIIVETAFGNIPIKVSKIKNHDIIFINRHGKKSNIPPHKVNYHANIQAFDSSHVDCILSVGTVGSMKKNIYPGDFVVPHDFIDFTKSRSQTYFNDRRIHIDMTNPYCTSLRDLLIKNCKKFDDIKLHKRGVYLTTEGPRLETVSEINLFLKFADIVGMTSAPEVILAREKGICYASLCIVCNMAAGLQEKLDADEISQIYSKKKSIISKILLLTINSINEKGKCECNRDLAKAML